jgi:hypothetical protein
MRRPRRHLVNRVSLLLALLVGQAARGQDSPPRSTSTVGMPARIDQLVLPGPELEATPIEDRRTPVVVRIVNSYPHGSAFRYDLVYYGLEPGRYDLKDYLRRKDGSPAKDLPSILVSVEPVLPPGQVEPHRLELASSPFLGGYRLLVLIGGITWSAGLLAILLLGRHRRAEAEAVASRPLTLADRLRPLVDAAMAGKLSGGQHAELERLLIGYWRRRLKLEQAAPARFMAVLRDHEEAGPLLRQLENWLHRPAGTAEPVDVAALLRPYQAIPADQPEDEELVTATLTASSIPGANPASSPVTERHS